MDQIESYRLLIAEVDALARAVRRSEEALARRVGHTAARWHVLGVVADAPRTVAASARRLGLTRQSVQRVVDELVEAGQLALRVNPDHRRAPLVAITDDGRAALDALDRAASAKARALLKKTELTTAKLARARKVVTRLATALPDS